MQNIQYTRILHDICPKNIFPYFYGVRDKCPPFPVTYAYEFCATILAGLYFLSDYGAQTAIRAPPRTKSWRRH